MEVLTYAKILQAKTLEPLAGSPHSFIFFLAHTLLGEVE